jgi:flavin reductase (DIM6/NTAB) family NADH-FMN oxidoreductase RutF
MSDVVLEPENASTVRATLPSCAIVLVSTRDNVLTINQIARFTFAPLRIGIAGAHARHTHALLVEERAFVVNVPAASLVEAARTCGRVSGRDSDKFRATGLTRAGVHDSKCARPRGSASLRRTARARRTADVGSRRSSVTQ